MLNPDRILPQLASADRTVRLAAARAVDEALHAAGAEHTADWASLTGSLLHPLVGALGDEDKGVQVHAASILQLLLRHSDAVAPALRAALSAPKERRALGAAIVAARAGLWYPEMDGVLSRALGAADRDSRWAAATLAAELGQSVPEAVSMVRMVLAAGEPVARRMAAYALRAMGAYTDVEADLIRALRDPVPEVRRAAVVALSKLPVRSESAVQAIAALQADTSPFVARTAGAVVQVEKAEALGFGEPVRVVQRRFDTVSRYANSEAIYTRALAHIVGGVNSPARSFKAVGGGAPVFMNRGQGAYLWDVDGNRYIDYLAAYGPGILGHAHPEIVSTVIQAVQNGTLYGTPTPWEVELADRLCEALPAMDRIRFVSSGTEAVMSAVRVARAYTGRPKVIKMEGCYHGHSDFALIAAGSGPSQLGQPDSAGVTESVAQDVITVPYNDLPALSEALAAWGGQVACVITEPIVGNFGIVNPEPGYLEGVRELAHQHGALLIFDEVITAFRVAYGGAQTLLGVEPDLTTLGKVIGGGVALGAYGGKAEIMDYVAPLGPAYQAGTLAGNPLSVQVALKALEIMGRPGVYERLENDGAYLADNLTAIARQAGLTLEVGRNGSMFTLFFTDKPVRNYRDAERSDKEQFAAMFRGFLDQGVCLAPSRFEAWMISIQHSRADLDETLEKAETVFRAMGQAQSGSDA